VVTVNDLRSLVRTQTQTDEADLPNATIDSYLQQGFERTINAESQWPFYASTWELSQVAGEGWMVLPGNVNPPGIMALTDDLNGFRLEMVPQVWAEDRFRSLVATANPVLFSVWGDRINLWPGVTFNADRTYHLRGYRKPLTWLDPVTESPDCDQRLHMPLAHFAVALAYAQQEDDALEAVYATRWQNDVELARRAIMEPVHQRPLVGAGSIGGKGWYPFNTFVVVPP
jgi:hypothetical protein